MGSTRMKQEAEKKEEKTEEAKKVKEEKVEKKPRPAEKELRTIVRVAGTDLDGEKPLVVALRGIKGISYAISNAVCSISGFDHYAKLGSLKEAELEKIGEIIKDPIKFGVPIWLINRRNDIETGKDMHLVGADLDVARRFDVQRMIDMKSYKGVRHMLGLPSRGQRTRSHFRKGKVVGVMKKEVRVAMAKAGTEEKKEEKKK